MRTRAVLDLDRQMAEAGEAGDARQREVGRAEVERGQTRAVKHDDHDVADIAAPELLAVLRPVAIA